MRASCVAAVDALADKTDPRAALALALRLSDAEASVASGAWQAIRKRLLDADPDVNRVWLEEVRLGQLNLRVRGEVEIGVLGGVMIVGG